MRNDDLRLAGFDPLAFLKEKATGKEFCGFFRLRPTEK